MTRPETPTHDRPRHSADSREIEAEAPQYNARSSRREDLHESLVYFWVRFDGEPTPFESGQYMTIGVFADDKIVAAAVLGGVGPARRRRHRLRVLRPARPGRRVHAAALGLPVGHRMRMIGPKGKFTLEPDDDRTHLFISSGHRQCAVRLDDEGDCCARARRAGPSSSTACRTCATSATGTSWRAGRRPASTRSHTSRRVARRPTPRNAGWMGRTGRVGDRSSARCSRSSACTPDNTIAYICGNPDMILAAEQTLLGARLPRGAGQEGALLAEGQGAPLAGTARRRGARRRAGLPRPR